MPNLAHGVGSQHDQKSHYRAARRGGGHHPAGRSHVGDSFLSDDSHPAVSDSALRLQRTALSFCN